MATSHYALCCESFVTIILSNTTTVFLLKLFAETIRAFAGSTPAACELLVGSSSSNSLLMHLPFSVF